MLNPGFSEALTANGFASRATVLPDGSVTYQLADKSGSVSVPRAEWVRLGQVFEARVAPVRRRTRWLGIALFPAIFLYGMTLAQVLPFGGAIILASVVLGPLVIYLAHAYQVRAIGRSIEQALSGFAQTVPAERDIRRSPRALEIAFLVLVGPHLLVALIGEIGGPDTFRGTPWSGTRIGVVELAAFAVILLRVSWPKLAPLLVRSQR